MKKKLTQHLEQLLSIGIALSYESDIAKLLDNIVSGAKSIANADGGTLYFLNGESIEMQIIHSTSLAIFRNKVSGQAIGMPSISLYLPDGSPNLTNVASYVYHKNHTINIRDAYDDSQFDFSGTKIFDRLNCYRSQSFLAVPMRNHEGDTIGILQLINAQHPETNRIIEFDVLAQRFTEALASLAAIVLTKQQLIFDLERMFETLIKLMATAIDETSPYTGAHCRRLPELTLMIAEAAHNTNEGYLKDFVMDDKDRYELTIAGWLHDCGKISTPIHVIDKATKLESIYDRIDLIKTRFEVVKRDAEIAMLRSVMEHPEQRIQIEMEFQGLLDQLEDDQLFLEKANKGGESMTVEDLQRILKISQIPVRLGKHLKNLLTEDEVYNLNITRGTLTDEERSVVKRHITTTIAMLEKIPFPKHLKNVPEYAAGHHERVDGKGYPKQLTRDQMSIQSRCMAIADIFEALTAKDRPYKEPKTLSEALYLLEKMRDDGHIDGDIYKAFVNHKVYLKYAQQHLDSSQIDIE